MELKPISHFYNKRIYVIPDYQRGYSWKTKQIYDLLNDLKHANQLESDHYTGTITIHKQDQDELIGMTKYSMYHLVDGQQRFTTITLILNYLLKKLGSQPDYADEVKEKTANYIINKGTYLFRYEIDQVSQNYFHSVILEHQSLSSPDENLYTFNLKNAKRDIAEYFKQPHAKDKELEYLMAIENRLMFNEYIVNTTGDIGVVFETMNNRGIGLSDLEIVKNRLLFLATKIKIEDEEHRTKQVIDNINQKWAIILRNLTLPHQTLDENSFLNNHWTIYYGWTKDNQAKDQILNKIFTIEQMVKDPIKMQKDIEAYVNSLAVTSLHWRFINYPTEKGAFKEVDNNNLRNKIKKAFEKLNRLNNSTVRPLLLSFMGLMSKKPTDLLEMAQLAEVFSFRLFSMNRKRSDTGKADIYRHCSDWHNDYTNDEMIAHAKFYLAWYIDNHGDWDRFEYEINELFDSSKKQGYYSWVGLPYFLYEYEEHLRKNQDSKLSYDFASKKTKSVEHIIPQAYQEFWEIEMAAIEDDEKEVKRCLHSLGNLLLITTDKNSSLRNSSYENKRGQYYYGSFSEIEIADNNDHWNPVSVANREDELLKFIKKNWKTEDWFQDKYPNPYYQSQEEDITDEIDDDLIEE